jgi:hypothetical protein
MEYNKAEFATALLWGTTLDEKTRSTIVATIDAIYEAHEGTGVGFYIRALSCFSHLDSEFFLFKSLGMCGKCTNCFLFLLKKVLNNYDWFKRGPLRNMTQTDSDEQITSLIEKICSQFAPDRGCLVVSIRQDGSRQERFPHQQMFGHDPRYVHPVPLEPHERNRSQCP